MAKAKILTLQVLLVTAIQHQYWLASQKMKVLPRVLKKVEGERLRESLERHIEETESHIERIESAFSALDIAQKRVAHPYFNIDALVREDVLKIDDTKLRDAAIMAGLMQLAHAEAAGYQHIATWSDILGENTIADEMRESLDEVKTFEETLVETTESEITSEEEVAEEVD